MSWKSFDLICDAPTKQALGNAVIQELGYRNHIVSSINSILRVYPEAVLDASKNYMGLFGLIAKIGFDPAENEKTKEMSSKLLEVLKIPVANDVLYPNIRKLMATSILEANKSRADNLINIEKNQVPVQLMEVLDPKVYRHAQIMREDLKVAWRPEHEITLVLTPYHKRAFAVKQNLLEMNWKSMFIHQTPFQDVDLHSQWQITLNNDKGYHMNYRDDSFGRK